MRHRYLIALGSNVRHPRHGRPDRVLRAALGWLERHGMVVDVVAPWMASAPLGPSLRRYANGAVVVRCNLSPPEVLLQLKAIERAFGRRAGGRRWCARVLDLDIVLWSGGNWQSPGLRVPHVAFRARDFVLRPATAIAPRWRDPLTGLTMRHLSARLTRPRPVPIGDASR